ncbi:MAG: exonuclease V subunit gamma [Chlamydiae bacterium]|nr:exonuclease V subunit gamma [Chlamydiota bacterium]
MKYVFLSNSSSRLLLGLEETLFDKTKPPLRKRFIVLPHKRDKEAILKSFLSRKKAVIGLQFFTLNELLKFEKETLIALEIEYLINEHLNDEEFCEVKRYIDNDQKKIPPLASSLARTFRSYELYGLDVLDQMSRWQKILWKKRLQTISIPSCEIHFFRIAHIPEGAKRILEQLDADLYYYMLSPTQYYWGDLCSDRQRVYLQKTFQKKNAPQKECDEFDLYARDRNPLLANSIKYSVDLFTDLVDQGIETFESYEEGLRIQNDLLYFENHKDMPSNISIHATATKRREIEVLYNNILSLFHKDPSLKFDEIRIYAPSIKEYFSHIQMVFESKESILHDFVVSDLPSSIPNKDLQTALFAKDPFEIFYTSSFCEKFSLNVKQIDRFKDWHTIGVDQVIMSLALPFEEKTVEISETPLLETFITLYEACLDALNTLKYKEQTLEEWILFLRSFIENFLEIDDQSISSYLGELTTLFFQDKKFPFSFLKPYIEEFFQALSYTYRSSKNPGLIFSNLGEGSIIPVKHLFLLGMDEECFPAKYMENPINELSSKKGYYYEPSVADKDRYAFLTALLTPSESLTISYQNIHPDDGKTLISSLNVQELIDYTGDLEIFHHFGSSFHPYYFSKKAEYPSYSQKEYKLAERFQKKEEIKPQSILKEALKRWNIKDLANLHEPTRFYANKSCGVYLKTANEDEEFAFSYLNRSSFRKKLEKKSAEEVLREFDQRSTIQNPLFKKIAIDELKKDLIEAEEFLHDHSWDRKNCKKITFHPDCKKSFIHSKNHTVMPPLKIGDQYEIIGTLPLSYVNFGKDTKKELIKLYPYLLLLNLIEKPSFVLFTEEEKKREIILDDPEKKLSSLLDYATLNLFDPCPFRSDWHRVIHDEKKWEQEVLTSDDPYIQVYGMKENISKFQTIVNEHYQGLK